MPAWRSAQSAALKMLDKQHWSAIHAAKWATLKKESQDP
jgi:hypothetical protein